MQETKKLIAANNNDVYIQLAKDGSIFLTKSDRGMWWMIHRDESYDIDDMFLFTEVEGAFNLLVVITLQAKDVNAAVKELIKTLTQTESTKTSLKQKM